MVNHPRKHRTTMSRILVANYLGSHFFRQKKCGQNFEPCLPSFEAKLMLACVDFFALLYLNLHKSLHLSFISYSSPIFALFKRCHSCQKVCLPLSKLLLDTKPYFNTRKRIISQYRHYYLSLITRRGDGIGQHGDDVPQISMSLIHACPCHTKF